MLWAVKDGNAYFDEFEIWPGHCEAQVVKPCLFHHFRYTEKIGEWWWGRCLDCPVVDRKHESFFRVNDAMSQMEASADTCLIPIFASYRTAFEPLSERTPHTTAGVSTTTGAPAPHRGA